MQRGYQETKRKERKAKMINAKMEERRKGREGERDEKNRQKTVMEMLERR